MKMVQNRDEHGTETRITARTTAVKYYTMTKNICTFLMHQQLQLIFDSLIPMGDVYMQGVITTCLLICSLLPALKRLQQTVPRLGRHMVN